MVLYLFAGAKRQRDIAAFVKILAEADFQEQVHLIEFDIARCTTQDLSKVQLQNEIKQAIQDGFIHMVILSPPCSSWSRALFNQVVRGPRPLRSERHPWGLPWLSGLKKALIDKANVLTKFALEVAKMCSISGVAFILERPEDLGRYKTGARPASIWQLPELRELSEKFGAVRRVLHQRHWGAASPKPTAFIATFPLHGDFGGRRLADVRCSRVLPRSFEEDQEQAHGDGPWHHSRHRSIPTQAMQEDRADDHVLSSLSSR